MRVSTGQRPVGTPLVGTMHKMQKARCVVAQFDLETDKADVDSPLSAVIMFKAKKNDVVHHQHIPHTWCLCCACVNCTPSHAVMDNVGTAPTPSSTAGSITLR